MSPVFTRSSYVRFLLISFHLGLDRPSRLFHFRASNSAFFLSPMPAPCVTRFFLFDFITPIMSEEDVKSFYFPVFLLLPLYLSLRPKFLGICPRTPSIIVLFLLLKTKIQTGMNQQAKLIFFFSYQIVRFV